MPLKFVDRKAQDSAAHRFGFLQITQDRLGDPWLDGEDINSGVLARRWVPEPDIHKSNQIGGVTTTRNFLGPTTNIIRDEMRRRTVLAYVNTGSLVIKSLSDSVTRQFGSNVWRSHLVLNKYTGEVIPVFVERQSNSNKIYFGQEELKTAATLPDFPFADLSQVPIGFVQEAPASYGLITYKDRKTGKHYRRRISGQSVSDEMSWDAPTSVGGISFGIAGDLVVARIDSIDNNRIVPMLSESRDGGQTFSSFAPIELNFPELNGLQSAITHSPPVVDHNSNIHIPVAMFGEQGCVALDVLYKETVVEAVRIPQEANPRRPMPFVALERFPKSGGSIDPNFGNGVTDGLGMIMVVASDGNLYTSNSQAGGINFPPPAHLNHEMPLVATYDSSECYTSGDKPNIVSMDYIYLEADSVTGKPVSGSLHFETWDMPLPVPLLKATAAGNSVQVTIERDAFFYPGQTTFAFDDPNIGITAIAFSDNRNARIETNRSAQGAILSFEAKTLFYHHAGEVKVT